MSKQLAERIMETARAEGEYITELLRGLIRIPSPSCREEESINYIRAEMEKLELDEMFVDNIGNIVGRFGTGKRVILCDSHIDTVGVGNRDAWRFDPFEARMENGVIYGRGASDNKAGLACMVGALRILSLVGERGDFSLYVVGIVQEEDCEGLALSVRNAGREPRSLIARATVTPETGRPAESAVRMSAGPSEEVSVSVPLAGRGVGLNAIVLEVLEDGAPLYRAGMEQPLSPLDDASFGRRLPSGRAQTAVRSARRPCRRRGRHPTSRITGVNTRA